MAINTVWNILDKIKVGNLIINLQLVDCRDMLIDCKDVLID